MKKIYWIVAGLIVVLSPVAYWLISPLFRNETVDEDFTDLLEMAGVEMPASDAPMEVVDTPVVMPPAGIDPRAESTPPTAPPPSMPVATTKQGLFEGLAGHSGEGTASLVSVNGKYFVRLEDDFRVTNGPDLYVGFGKDGAYAADGEIARLKGNIGGQNYEVPAGIDVSQFNEVWIWCRAFSVPFAKAKLQ